MARSLDIETLIEDAFISLLPTYFSTNVEVKRWDDIKDKDLTPVVKVKATLTTEEPGTGNLFCASNVMVDIACFTSRRDDESGRVANGIRGEVRCLINQEDIVDLLNATDGLSTYNNGVLPSDSNDLTDGKIWQKQQTVLVVATTA